MNRRNFLSRIIQSFTAAAVALGLPWVSSAYTLRPSPTIAQLLTVSFPAARQAALKGTHWASHTMRALERQGRVRIVSLGTLIEVPSRTGPSYITDVEEVMVPIVWKIEDDTKTEADKVRMVTSLIQNAMWALDLVLEQQMGDRSAFVSKKYRYWLDSPVQHGEHISVRMFTTAGFVPTHILTGRTPHEA